MFALFLMILAASLVLFAAPWDAPVQYRQARSTWLIVLAGLTQLPVLLHRSMFVAPLLGAVLVLVWAFDNRHIPGMWLLMLGVVCNSIAMFQHGGMMPLDPRAATELGRTFPSTVPIAGTKDVVGNLNAWLWLGDWIIVRLPQFTLVGSPGDVIILSAILYWAGACRVAALQISFPRRKIINSAL